MTIFMWQCYLIDMSSQNMNGTFTALTLPNHRCCYKTGQPIRNWSIRYSSFQIHEMKEQQLPLILPNCLLWLFDYLKKKACDLVTRIITGSYVTTTRKPQFSEEDLWSRVESSKFRPMFAGVIVSFHLHVWYVFSFQWAAICVWVSTRMRGCIPPGWMALLGTIISVTAW